MNINNISSRWLVVVGAILIQLALGALYAWSVFTKLLTDPAGIYQFTATQTAWIFSAGLATFALVMVLAGRWQAKTGPRLMTIMGGLLLGLGLTAFLVGRSTDPSDGGDGAAVVEEAQPPPIPVEEPVPVEPESQDASLTETADPPAEEPEEPEEPVVASGPPATLNLRHENRLRHAWMTVWIDGKQVWSEEIVGPKSAVKRAFGQEIQATISTTAGEHEIEVRVTETSEEVDARETIRGNFSAGDTRRLEISLKRKLNKLQLSWSP